MPKASIIRSPLKVFPGEITSLWQCTYQDLFSFDVELGSLDCWFLNIVGSSARANVLRCVHIACAETLKYPLCGMSTNDFRDPKPFLESIFRGFS